MTFIKKIENFVCEKCNHENIGTGFTDHCEKCLWSKHVDVDPGDRRENCGGLMEPFDIQTTKGEQKLVERCTVCGFRRPSPILQADDFEEVLRVAKNIAKKKSDLLR